MRNPRGALSEVDKLEKLINDKNAPIMGRVLSLCQLYHLYQGDVHMQSKTITRIEDLIRAL